MESKCTRIADHKIFFGVSSDEVEGDEWSLILVKIKACDILVMCSPIWFGVRSSVAQMVIGGLEGTYGASDLQTGQFPLYGKVAGMLIAGN